MGNTFEYDPVEACEAELSAIVKRPGAAEQAGAVKLVPTSVWTVKNMGEIVTVRMPGVEPWGEVELLQHMLGELGSVHGMKHLDEQAEIALVDWEEAIERRIEKLQAREGGQ